MTIVQGKILAGEIIGSRVSRKIIVTPDFPFVDESTNEPSIVILPFEESINDDGRFVIEVPQSESVVKDAGSQAGITESVTYEWKIVENLTEVIEEEEVTKENEIFKIHAICPDDDIVDFSTLVAIPSHGSWLGIGVRRIANVLTDPTQPYLDQLSFQLNSRGGFDESISYAQRDLVSYQGGSYFWRPSTPSDTPAPIPGESDEWQLVSERGETGAGTTANLDGYNPDTWEGSNEAAARGDVVDAIASINVEDSIDIGEEFYENAEFTGRMKRLSDVPTTNNEDEVVNVKFLESRLGTAAIDLLPKPIVYVKRLSEQRLTRGVPQKITWQNSNDSIGYDQGNYWSGGDRGELNLSAGFYLMFVSFRLEVRGAPEYYSYRVLTSVRLYQSSPVKGTMGHFYQNDQIRSGEARTILAQGFVLVNLNGTESLVVQVEASGQGTVNGAKVLAQANNNFLSVWRFG